MARKTDKGVFVPKHPEKYIGPNLGNITYRSSWELTVMLKFDDHPNVVYWASESIRIPYQNPLTGKFSVYVPDFMVVYVDRSGTQHREVMEVKPLKETPGSLIESNGRKRRLSQRDKLAQAVNAAKWQAAAQFCAKRQLTFRVLTENSLFGR